MNIIHAAVFVSLLCSAGENRETRPDTGRPTVSSGSILEQIERLDKEIVKRSQELEWTRKRIRETEDDIRNNKNRISRLKERLAGQKTALKRRMRVLARLSREGMVGLLLGGDSVKDMRARFHYVEALIGWDKKQIYGYAKDIEALEKAESELRLQLKALSQLKSALVNAQEAAIEERSKKKKLLIRIYRDKGLRRKRLAESMAVTKKLGSMSSDESVSRKTDSFRKSKGRMPCPIDMPVVRGFGVIADPVLNVAIRHPGFSFKASLGQEVRSIHDGKVAYSGWLKAFGQVIIVDHGAGFYSLYAHLSRTKVDMGDEVATGQVLGTAGDTGSVRKPKLYFEIRYHGRPINPARWVKCRRK